MEMNLNFKRVDINAFTLKEAEVELAKQVNFETFANATQAWKNAGSPRSNTKEFKEFCANYLANKTKNKQGLGCVIVYEPGKADTRERPYKFTNIVNSKGKRKYVTTYTMIDPASGDLLAKTTENKAKAEEIAKSLYTKSGYRGKVKCYYTKEVAEGEPLAFEMEYQPSKSATTGTFIFFGIENN